MHAYPSKMRTIGTSLGTIADDTHTNATEAVDGVTKAGTGNEGFATVGAAAKAATDWIEQVKSVGTDLDDAGKGLIKAASALAGTDEDNERIMPVVAV